MRCQTIESKSIVWSNWLAFFLIKSIIMILKNAQQCRETLKIKIRVIIVDFIDLSS